MQGFLSLLRAPKTWLPATLEVRAPWPLTVYQPQGRRSRGLEPGLEQLRGGGCVSCSGVGLAQPLTPSTPHSQPPLLLHTPHTRGYDLPGGRVLEYWPQSFPAGQRFPGQRHRAL